MLTNTINSMISRAVKTNATTLTGRLQYIRKGTEMNPVGGNNSKTQALGTYRPVGVSCPDTCEWLDNGCYAQSGPCNLAQSRASSDPSLSVLSVVAAVIASNGDAVRLHVAGDFWLREENRIHSEYIKLLVKSLRYLQFRDIPVTVWTYTACDLTSEQLSELKSAGVHVRRSGIDTNVARIAPKGSFQCPTQVDKAESCAACKLCWTVKKQVNFIPHAGLAKKM